MAAGRPRTVDIANGKLGLRLLSVELLAPCDDPKGVVGKWALKRGSLGP